MLIRKIIYTVALTLSLINSAMAAPGDIKWSMQLDGSINAAPALGADGTVYITSQSPAVWAINPDGSKKWQRLLNATILKSPVYPLGTPLVHPNGSIYIAANSAQFIENSLMIKLSPVDGSIQNQVRYYTAPTANMVVLSPVLDANNNLDTMLYTGADTDFTGYLINFSPDSLLGNQPIALYADTFNYATNLNKPFVDNSNGKISVAAINQAARENYIEVADTNVFLAHKITNPTADITKRYSPVSGNHQGIIYFGDSLGNLTAYQNNGNYNKVWSIQLAGDLSHAAPTIAPDGTIYVGSSNGYLYSVTPVGTVNWSIAVDPANPSGISKELALTSDGLKLYLVTDNGNLYCVDTRGGMRWMSSQSANTAPLIAPDGTIYVGTTTNKLVAITS